MIESDNTLSLVDIVYPVYILGTEKPLVDNGVTYYLIYREDLVTGEDTTTIKVLDDTSIKGDTLAKRRLYLADKNVHIKPLTNAIFFLGDLIKLTNPRIWLIDSLGRVFNYKKTTRAKLKFHPIKQIKRISSGGAIIEVKDTLTRFKTLYEPLPSSTYVGLLHIGKALILYGVYNQKYEDTWRLV